MPTGPTAYGNSPYQPLSSFAGNELLIDISALLQQGLLLKDELAPLEALPADSVDYGALIPVKQALLRRAASRFVEKSPGYRVREFSEFVARHDKDWLHDYALFRVLKSKHNERPWQEWKKPFAHRKTKALQNLGASHKEEIESVKIIQFLYYLQWRELRQHAEKRGVWLFGDMPIYIALDSAEAWANSELLLLDEHGHPQQVAGVPPDYFSEDGQLWGNPVYDWQFHKAQGYRWWVERVRHSIEMSHLVRIDHFRGFESYWSIPAGEETAQNGRWIPGPGGELFDALRDALGEVPIIAEDLGVITPEVEALRDSYQIPGMVVLQFAVCDDDFRFDDMPENRVCYTGTHDNDTTMGWFNGSNNDTRSEDDITHTRQRVLDLTNGTTESVHRDMIQLAFSSNARLAVAPMQDFLGLGSSARFNTPGKGGDNWCWRLASDDLTDELVAEYRAATLATARGV